MRSVDGFQHSSAGRLSGKFGIQNTTMWLLNAELKCILCACQFAVLVTFCLVIILVICRVSHLRA